MDEQLPPLPESEYLLAIPDRPYDPGYVTIEDGYTADQMRAYAAAAVAAERERCALLAEAKIDPEWPNDDMSQQAEGIAAAIRSQ